MTKRFPYHHTEAFLESEYPFYSSEFDNVVFFPILKGKVRKNCTNANVNDIYNKLYKKKYRLLLLTLFSKHFYKSVLECFSKLLRRDFLRKLIVQDLHYRIAKKIISQNSSLFDKETIVYCYWFNSIVYAMLKLREEYGCDYKVVCRAHRFDVYDENGIMPHRKYCLDKIDRIFPISQDAVNVLSAQCSNKNKIILSRLGVHNHGIIAPSSDPFSFNLLSISQTSKRKRVILIFHSIQEYAKQNPTLNICWTHFGDGPLDKELSVLCKNIGLCNLQIKLKGRVPNEVIVRYMSTKAIDAFINLSSSEGVPVSIMEAQSFGLPVIATNVGGTGEIVNNNNGILLSANPTTEEIISAYTKISNTYFNRECIKKEWGKTSNAEIVFPLFVKKLSEILHE